MKEENLINNTDIKITVCNKIANMLLSNNYITENEINKIKVNFGYIFKKSDGLIESLLKVLCEDKVYYCAIQNNSIKLINITEVQYKDTILHMEELHECLKIVLNNETSLQKERREKNNEFLTKNNITINNNLLSKMDDQKVKLKNIDEICKRAITCLITIQVACDINNGKDIKSAEYKDDLDFVKSLYKKFDVENCLNSKEKRVIEGNYSAQDVIDMDWAYEAYWALCWCLNLVDDISDGGLLCDCTQALSFVIKSNSFDEFKNQCNLRSVKEILDMYDLYYRYNWAINNKYVDVNTNIGNLNASNVVERRRALEWILSETDDWYDLQLNA